MEDFWRSPWFGLNHKMEVSQKSAGLTAPASFQRIYRFETFLVAIRYKGPEEFNISFLCHAVDASICSSNSIYLTKILQLSRKSFRLLDWAEKEEQCRAIRMREGRAPYN